MILRRWIWVASIAMSLVGCGRAPESDTRPALVGTWRSRVQFSSGAFASIQDLEFLYVFNLGGTLTESSNYDGVPPVPPAYGEWRETGERQFEAKYTFFTTSAPTDLKALTTGGGWSPAGSGVLTERITVAVDGQSFDSTIGLELFDMSGNPAAGGGQATGHATRAGFSANRSR